MIAKYTKTAMILHWVIAALIIANVALAWIWPTVADDQVRALVGTHKSIGVTVLGLVILRLLWRLTHRPPPLPSRYQPWERALSRIVHTVLYGIMFIMPLSGWAMDSARKSAVEKPLQWFGLFDWPRLPFLQNTDPASLERLQDASGAAHGLAAYALYALVFLHIAGALKHQFLDRRPELQRMWG